MKHDCICGKRATFKATRIIPGGEVSPSMGVPLGEMQITWWCDEHFAILAKETIFRYTFEQLETTPQRRRSVAGQESWRWELNDG